MISRTFSTHDDKYMITSYGNGWAYEITREKDGASVFIQDDDAAMWRDEYDDFTK